MKQLRNVRNVLKVFGFSIFFMAFSGCDNWMNNPNFFKNIDDEVLEATAEIVTTNIQYAIPNVMGSVEPSGSYKAKVGLSFDIQSTTTEGYTFYKWYAFSLDDKWNDENGSVFFDINASNSKVMYDSEEKLATLEAHALTEKTIAFEDCESPSTKVTFVKKADNVVIVPVCKKNITILETDPYNGEKNVVINKSIKIAFSKQLSLSNFINEEKDGLSNKITVKYKGSNFGSLDEVEINDRFGAPYFADDEKNTNYGRILILPLNEEKEEECLLEKNRVHEIVISGSISDIQGCLMGTDYSLTFTTGSSKDESAPGILQFKAGTKTPLDFDKINFKPASNNLSDYTAVLGNRTGDTDCFFYLWAGDIANLEDVPDEGQVESYNIIAKTLISSSSTSIGNDILEFNDITYYSGYSSAQDKFNSVFDLTGSNNGLIDCLNLSSLPDGLIELHVFAKDRIGNISDESEEDASELLRTNGYILFVKDTTPPLVDSSLISIKNTDNVYFNEFTISNIVFDLSKIKDYGIEGLNSSKVYAIVSSKEFENNEPSLQDANWKLVSEDYNLRGISIENEGNISLYLCLKDDVGNITAPQKFSNIIKYDNTAPSIGTTEWVNERGEKLSNFDKKNSQEKRYIKIPFVEKTSGIDKIKFNIRDVETGLSILPDFSSFEIYKDSITDANKIPYTKDSNDSNAIILDNKITSGNSNTNYSYLYISDVTVSASIVEKEINFQLIDQAGNYSQEQKATNAQDVNPASVKNFKIIDKKERNIFGVINPVKQYWISDNVLGGNYTDISFNLYETQSGVKEIVLQEELSLETTITSMGGFLPDTGNVELTVNNIDLMKNQAYEINTEVDETARKLTYRITFIDSYNPVCFNVENEFTEVKIKGLRLYAENTETKVKIIEIEDFSGNKTKKSGQEFISSDSAYVCAKEEPAPANVTINHNTAGCPDGITNENIVSVTINSTSNVSVTPGISSFTFENVALTEDSTVILTSGYLVDKLLIKDEDYAVRTGGKELVFEDKVLNGTYTLKITNLSFDEATSGEKNIKFDINNRVKYVTPVLSQNKILFDFENPVVNNVKVMSNNKVVNEIVTNDFANDGKIFVNCSEGISSISRFKVVLKDENGDAVTSPLTDCTVTITDEDGNTLPNTIDTDNYDYINLLTPYEITGESETFTIEGLKFDVPSNTFSYKLVYVYAYDQALNSSLQNYSFKNIFNTSKPETNSMLNETVIPTVDILKFSLQPETNHDGKKEIVQLTKFGGDCADFSFKVEKLYPWVKFFTFEITSNEKLKEVTQTDEENIELSMKYLQNNQQQTKPISIENISIDNSMVTAENPKLSITVEVENLFKQGLIDNLYDKEITFIVKNLHLGLNNNVSFNIGVSLEDILGNKSDGITKFEQNISSQIANAEFYTINDQVRFINYSKKGPLLQPYFNVYTPYSFTNAGSGEVDGMRNATWPAVNYCNDYGYGYWCQQGDNVQPSFLRLFIKNISEEGIQTFVLNDNTMFTDDTVVYIYPQAGFLYNKDPCDPQENNLIVKAAECSIKQDLYINIQHHYKLVSYSGETGNTQYVKAIPGENDDSLYTYTLSENKKELTLKLPFTFEEMNSDRYFFCIIFSNVTGKRFQNFSDSDDNRKYGLNSVKNAFGNECSAEYNHRIPNWYAAWQDRSFYFKESQLNGRGVTTNIDTSSIGTCSTK